MTSLLFYTLTAQSASEVIDRIPSSFSHFVLPFVIGISFMLCWLGVGFIRLMAKLTREDRRKFALSLVTPKILLKDIKELFGDCLFHVKIWKRKPLLGYMHSAIAFGWFALIVLGHLEVALFVPKHLSFTEGSLFYPIFYRFFVWVNPEHVTLRGSFFFFLMDFFLLYVLSGIALAMFKRFKSIALGMKHTTKPSACDRVALYSLWLIFPLRLLAESFTADLSGGSFLTIPVNKLWHLIFGGELWFMPVWWAYSISLGLFFCVMPFSRYMHILTEVLWILLRNAGIKPRHPRKGVAEAEIYACSSCGLCIDACPMNVQKSNLRYSSVYFIRFLRRHTRKNERKINLIADKCLMCDKCHSLCPVAVDAPALRREQRKTVNNVLPSDLSCLKRPSVFAGTAETDRAETTAGSGEKVLYFAGCMSHLTPRVTKSVTAVFKAAGVDFVFADPDGGICCGRPQALSGRVDAAAKMIEANTRMIRESGCTKLVLSCPICLKTFREDYDLQGIEVVHYTQYFHELIHSGRLKVSKSAERLVYHDPCELGRGCGVYDEPRAVVAELGELVPAQKERDESICCGGSLGSLTLSHRERGKISEASLANLTVHSPQAIVTACPLCLKTFSEAVFRRRSGQSGPANRKQNSIQTKPIPAVKDFAELIVERLAPVSGELSERE